MFLKRLMSGGPGGIAEWKRMWNDEVLPYLRGAQLVAGPGIRIDRRPAGTLIRVVSSGGAGGGNGGGNITLGAVVTSPTGGFGTGTAKTIVLNSDGTYTINSGGAVVGYINPYL